MNLAVEEEGPDGARRVVLVHGSMDRMAGFAKVARRLSGAFRVVRYDRRGYGASWRHPGPFLVSDHVDDLVALIGDRPSVVVGHSLGGNIALAAAQRLGPTLVPGVVVYECPLSWTDWWPGTSAGATAVRSSTDPQEVAEVFMRRMVGDRRWERLPASTREARRAEGPALVGEIASLQREAPWEASAILQPVMVGRGSEGRPHHLRGMEVLADWLPQAELVTLDGCGHLAHVSHPDRFTEDLVLPLLHRVG